MLDDVRCNFDRVNHTIFSVARVHIYAVHGEDDRVGAKSLVLHFADSFAVKRVGKIGTEFFNIKMICALADFFVRRHRNFDRPMFYFGMLSQIIDSVENFCNAGFVVSAQQRRPVAGDDVMTNLFLQIRVLLGADYDARVAKNNVTALVVLMNDWIDILPINSPAMERTIAAGEAVYAADLRLPNDVKRGDAVDVEVSCGGALLRFRAKAETGGRRGQKVLVRNPVNGRRFAALVEDKGKVSVRLGVAREGS